MADHTSQYKLDYDCNYLDPEKSNSSEFILSCINNPNIKNNLHYNNCLNTSIELLEDGIEPFSNDHSTKGPGVSYVPKGTCHDGYMKDGNGECNLQYYRGRIRDGNWQRGHHNETMHQNKDNYRICDGGIFLGLSNGYLLCDKEDEKGKEEKKEILSFTEVEEFANI